MLEFLKAASWGLKCFPVCRVHITHVKTWTCVSIWTQIINGTDSYWKKTSSNSEIVTRVHFRCTSLLQVKGSDIIVRGVASPVRQSQRPDKPLRACGRPSGWRRSAWRTCPRYRWTDLYPPDPSPPGSYLDGSPNWKTDRQEERQIGRDRERQ